MTGPRERLLDATISLVRERGVHGTGIADVLERSSTARGSVYQHVPRGKSELVAAAVRRAGRHVDDLMDAAPTPTARLDVLLAWWTRQVERRPTVPGCPVAAGALDADPEVRAAATEVLAGWVGRLTGPTDDPRLARFAISAFEGAVVQCRATGSSEPLDDLRLFLRPMLSESEKY